MNIKLLTNAALPMEADTLAIFMAKEDKFADKLSCSAGQMVCYLLEQGEFSGAKKQLCTAYLPKNDQNGIKKLILVGLGEQHKINTEVVRVATGQIIKKAKELKAKELVIVNLPQLPEHDDCTVSGLIAETVGLATYKFEDYKSKKEDNSLHTVHIASATGEDEKAFNEGVLLAEATNYARELVGTPSNILTPAALAEQAVLKGQEYGFETEVLHEDEIKEVGMEAFWQVARGSDNPPRFIIMRHLGNPKNSEDIIALVGKGLCYDSGGLSLKSSDGMKMMKTDMGGSAAVIGAMCAIAKQQLPVNVIGIVAACENIPSAHSYHPGDIINSLGGKTIHIGNTDAEGRLTLIDAVYYAVTAEKATRVLDIATLTGACIKALGTRVSGVIANDDDFYQRLEEASHFTGERIWRLPHFDLYKESIKHPEADLNNVGEGGAGTITAGLFIGEFTEGKPWIHVDIAGKAYTKKDLGYIAKGPTGVGVRNLYYLIKSYC